MIKKNNVGKVLALIGILALCLLLSGCYVPPDEITSNTENLTVGSNNLPFQTLAPATATTAPTATPTPYAGTQGGNTGNSGTQPTINWNDDWGTGSTSSPTNTDSASTTTAGSTISIITPTPKAASTTSSSSSATATPASTTLKKGSTGSDVRTMQKRLKELGYLSGSADGDFGTATEEAVKAFQKANGLTVDGKAGTKTLQKLYSDSAVKASSSSSSSSSNTTPKKTATPTPKKTATPTPKKTATPTPKPTATPDLSKATYLQSGSSGKKVKQLQQRLIDLGWLDGTADGEYGGATEAAVKAFQKKMGLWSDGIAGPDTQAKLYSSSAAKSSTPAASIGKTLEEGMNGDAVRALQKRLKALGYYSGTVDGDYGSGTVEAVKAFQRANGLTVDGKAGTRTLNAIYNDGASSSSSSSSSSSNSSSGSSSSTEYTTLQEGDESSSVKKLQQALKKLGFYTGSVDGKYGSGTTDAVRDFQKANNLTVDGKAGNATQQLLYSSNANSATTYATIREYDEGTAVKNLQSALSQLGYYDGKIDGIYGETTKDAVRAFQINNNLSTVDGVAGNKTLQKLYSSSAKSASAPNTNYTTLRKGDKGDDVVQLQDVLVQKGYLSTVTGVYDDATVTAVKNYQRNNGLSVDGSAGAETLTKLYGN